MLNVADMFQFPNGSIKRKNVRRGFSSPKRFQFPNGSIKS